MENQENYFVESKNKYEEYNKKYRLENREKILLQKKAYRQKNKQKINDYNNKYYCNNKEKASEYSQKYRQENREHLLAHEQCICGRSFIKSKHRSRHCLTNYHQDFMSMYNWAKDNDLKFYNSLNNFHNFKVNLNK
ncbi:MAG: hypothetical protein P4N59_33030 [Negativicutes bacterium]|nr:hypothetical protein [Negativicutes bacterium]